MNLRSAVRILLLIFVFASVTAILFQEMRERTTPAGSSSAVAAEAPKIQAVPARGLKPVAGQHRQKVVAYYFHTTVRCPTCRRIEALSDGALKLGFAEALRTGSLEWRLVNYQLPENRHFAQDYQLFTKSLVIVKFVDDKQVGWKNLEKVWELTQDPDSFFKYVQDEIRVYLESR